MSKIIVLMVGIAAVPFSLVADEKQQVHTIKLPFRKISSVTVINHNNNEHTISQVNNTQVAQPPVQEIKKSIDPITTAPSFFTSPVHYFVHSKAVTVATLAGIAYATFYGLLIITQHSLNDGWCVWQPSTTLKTLIASPQEALARSLFDSIKKRYLPANYNTSNYLDPIVGFMRDTDSELAALKRLATLARSINWCHAAVMFPGCMLDEHEIHEKIQRINYVKHLCITHLDVYTVTTSPA